MVAHPHYNHARLCWGLDNLWTKQRYFTLHLCSFLSCYTAVSLFLKIYKGDR